MTAFENELNRYGVPWGAAAPLSGVSTFRIGGPADYLVRPRNRSELLKVLAAVRECGLPHLLLGNGSNVLFDDAGLRGAVILTAGLQELRVNGASITAECGVSLTALANAAQSAALAGMEFAYGIPGSVGGGVVMNAGAYGGQISDVLAESDYCDASGECGTLPRGAHEYGYRESYYLAHPECVVLSAVFSLTPGDPALIRKRCEENMRARTEKQPLSLPSAGSVFKRPPGQFAGRLIEAAGLKGLRVGGAEVSEKHAGFIVNRGGATSHDVRALIAQIRDEVFRRFGVELECEIRYIPER